MSDEETDDEDPVLSAILLADEVELRRLHAEGAELLPEDRPTAPQLCALRGLASLLRACGELLRDREDPFKGAAQRAAEEGHLDCLDVLAELGADLSGLNADGWAPAHAAAAAGQAASLVKLRDLGALEVLNEEGWGPAHFAALSGSVASLEVLDGMLEDEDLEGERPAHKAAAAGHAECLRCLYVLGARLDAMEAAGRTPAHLAAAEGEAGCLRILAELGIALGAEDQAGETPLDKAKAENQAECVGFLQDWQDSAS